MRIMSFWLAVAFVAAVLVSGGEGGAQPPQKKGDTPDKFGPKKKGKGGFGEVRSLTAEDVTEHILSFDRNKTGKVTREQLPERMQHLVDLGDTNKDGALDSEEIRALVAKLEKEPRPKGFKGKGPPDKFGKKKQPQ